MLVFRRRGLQEATEKELARALSLSPQELSERYPQRAELVHAAVMADLARQRREHLALYAQYPNAVERLYSLLQYAMRDLADTSPRFYADLQQHYDKAWEATMDHLDSYSAPQLQQLLNDGIRDKLFRSDINIRLVTKILLEQVTMTLNPMAFPPEQFNIGEVFRSVFLYYVRGICTEEGARLAANHFSKL